MIEGHTAQRRRSADICTLHPKPCLYSHPGVCRESLNYDSCAFRASIHRISNTVSHWAFRSLALIVSCRPMTSASRRMFHPYRKSRTNPLGRLDPAPFAVLAAIPLARRDARVAATALNAASRPSHPTKHGQNAPPRRSTPGRRLPPGSFNRQAAKSRQGSWVGFPAARQGAPSNQPGALLSPRRLGGFSRSRLGARRRAAGQDMPGCSPGASSGSGVRGAGSSSWAVPSSPVQSSPPRYSSTSRRLPNMRSGSATASASRSTSSM